MDIRGNYYRDVESGMLFQRVLAGVAWAGDRPAGVVVIGEAVSFGPLYEHHLLAEIEEYDAGLFFKHCVDLQGKYNVESFVGRLDKMNIRYLSQWNSTRRDRNSSTLHVLSAPFSESKDIGYHIAVLKDKLRPNQKTLHFTEGSKLPGYLLEIQAGETKLKADQIPLVSALCYAVCAMVEWEYQPGPQHTTAITDYDIFKEQ
jgi:hypothetical protein